MDEIILTSQERLKIFKALCEHKNLTFNQLVKETNVQSNKLAYQLHFMTRKNFLVHAKGTYALTADAQQRIPYFSQILKKEVGVLPVILGIVRFKDKILLLQRKKMPYKGYWGLFGGKQINGESIPETIEREVFEECGLRARFERYNAIVHERLTLDNHPKHSFLFVITTLAVDSADAREQTEGKVAWFDFIETLDGSVSKVIPSDVYFLKTYTNSSAHIDHVVMSEHADDSLTLNG
ncbi:NUDIX domain-containing protein [Candidatus Woesearchaeota archaeon]|nr:NUDIX domain-containing protein [Candidatus Woesearchaeota archaeon]